jgi:hypothetical protein
MPNQLDQKFKNRGYCVEKYQFNNDSRAVVLSTLTHTPFPFWKFEYEEFAVSVIAHFGRIAMPGMFWLYSSSLMTVLSLLPESVTIPVGTRP